MTKHVIGNGDTGLATRNGLNTNFTELYTGAETVAATAKVTPVDADVLAVQDSAAANVKKKVAWVNIKATLKTYFDTIYAKLGQAVTFSQLTVTGESYGLLTVKSYSFTSQGILSGTYYAAGFYDAPLTDANLDEGSLTQAYGSANVSYAAHAFIVAGGAGAVDVGVVGLKVTGTRIEDDGTRTLSYEDIISADITTLSLNEYAEAVKFIGSVTFELYVVSGTPTAYSLDFNYGLAKYEDFGNHKFDVKGFEAVGLAGGNDSNFNITLLHHDSTAWIYSAAAFDPSMGHHIIDLQTIHDTEFELSNGKPFAFKITPIVHEDIVGNNGEGVIIRIIAGANNSVQTMDMHIGVKFVE